MFPVNYYNFYQMESEELLIKLIGIKIKNLREKEGLSQLQLGIRIDISANQIGRIERAEGNPTIKTLHAITKYYGLTISEFFKEVEELKNK